MKTLTKLNDVLALANASNDEAVWLAGIWDALHRYTEEQVIDMIKIAASVIERAEAMRALQSLRGLRVETQKPAPGCDICGLLLCDGDDHR